MLGNVHILNVRSLCPLQAEDYSVAVMRACSAG